MGIFREGLVRGRRTWRLESEWVILGLAVTSCVMIGLSLVLFLNNYKPKDLVLLQCVFKINYMHFVHNINQILEILMT